MPLAVIGNLAVPPAERPSPSSTQEARGQGNGVRREPQIVPAALGCQAPHQASHFSTASSVLSRP